ncbi:Uncharacterised protein [Suttonella ornithocola]|uniref:Uncharacterized protein n=1 Tax=Suttonella ornithocola TaxID=279832 RepID=A0A380MW20_9GAMM|nr:Uncharacterised protein [Suttonella ornithocola]
MISSAIFDDLRLEKRKKRFDDLPLQCSTGFQVNSYD